MGGRHVGGREQHGRLADQFFVAKAAFFVVRSARGSRARRCPARCSPADGESCPGLRLPAPPRSLATPRSRPGTARSAPDAPTPTSWFSVTQRAIMSPSRQAASGSSRPNSSVLVTRSMYCRISSAMSRTSPGCQVSSISSVSRTIVSPYVLIARSPNGSFTIRRFRRCCSPFIANRPHVSAAGPIASGRES